MNSTSAVRSTAASLLSVNTKQTYTEHVEYVLAGQRVYGMEQGGVGVGFRPSADGGRRASFTDVNPCAHDIVCPENLVGQRQISDNISVERFH